MATAGPGHLVFLLLCVCESVFVSELKHYNTQTDHMLILLMGALPHRLNNKSNAAFEKHTQTDLS